MLKAIWAKLHPPIYCPHTNTIDKDSLDKVLNLSAISFPSVL